MQEIFDQVIANLERNHAFKEVPGGGPLVEQIKADLAPLLVTPGRYGEALQTLVMKGFVPNQEDVD